MILLWESGVKRGQHCYGYILCQARGRQLQARDMNERHLSWDASDVTWGPTGACTFVP